MHLGPARGVGVPLGFRLGRAGSLPLLLLLRERAKWELPARCRRPFPAPPMSLTLPNSHRTFHDVGIRGSLRHLAPAFYPPVVPDLRIEDQGRIRGLGHEGVAHVDIAVVLALAPLPVRGQEVESVDAGHRPRRSLLIPARAESGRGLLTATARGVEALGLDVTCLDPRIDTGHAVTGRARDDSFRAVLDLSRNFHGMEEPAGVPSARCKTSLASVYGLMSEVSPAFTLPASPLLRTLLADINLALSKFLEDQTVHGFLPVPGRRHRRYYSTSSSSFPGPYTVPPGVTSITLEKVSEAKKRSVSLSDSQVSSMETMLSGVCEVSSWLDWWLSTCGGFRDHLPIEVRANFERLMISGSRALEFLASQGCTTLGNLVLARRDSLLADVRGTVLAEEVAHLRYSSLPETASIFPHPLLDSALLKMRAAASDALVQRTFHPPRIPRKPAATGQSGGSSTARSGQAGTSGAFQAQKQSASSSPSGQSSQRRKKGKGKAPFSSFSRGSGCSGGKGKGAGKRSA